MHREMHFEEFALRLQGNGEKGTVTLIGSAYGVREAPFTLQRPMRDFEELIQGLEPLLRSGRSARTMRNLETRDPSMDFSPEAIGTMLFQSLFPEAIRDAFLQSLARAEREPETGLRLRLVLDPRTPELARLAALPWELLCRVDTGDFIARNPLTPFVRYFEVPRLSAPIQLTSSFKVLVVTALPADVPPLNVEAERESLASGWRGVSGIVMEFIENPTLPQLRQKLLTDTFHAVHFICHGEFDEMTGEGALLFRNEQGSSLPIRGRVLAEALKSQRSLRLVLLNACDTGQISRQAGLDPFSGVASALVMAGLPAVVAMQYPISDRAALVFSQSFYTALAAGLPVDAAAAEGRLTIHLAFPDTWEWATPALFMSVPDGRILLPAEEASPSLIETSAPSSPPQSLRTGTSGAPGGITVGGVGHSIQAGVVGGYGHHIEGGIHLTTLSQLEEFDQKTRTEILSQYEQKVRDFPENAKYHFALGLSYLDRCLYDQAVTSFKRAQGKGLREANLHYYLALAALGGKQPRCHSLSRIREIESLLQAAIREDGGIPHFQFLLALIKYDYYLANGLRVPPPSIEDLLAMASRHRADKDELQTIAKHVPVLANPLARALSL
jgi:tetratricopeptide (TPR) repeat protein